MDVRELLDKFNVTKLARLPIGAGIGPVNVLLFSLNVYSLSKRDSCDGIEELNALWSRYNSCKLGSSQTSLLGKAPEIFLAVIQNHDSFVHSPSSEGKLPES